MKNSLIQLSVISWLLVLLSAAVFMPAPPSEVGFSLNLLFRGHGKGIVPLVGPADVDALTAPTNEKLFNLVFRGIGVTESAVETDSASATPEAAFNTDLTSAQRNDSYTQETVIRNKSTDHGGASAVLCVGTLAWSGVSTCQSLCAASSLTCSGAATDGKFIPAGTELPRTWDGTNCICVVGATTLYQVERLIR